MDDIEIRFEPDGAVARVAPGTTAHAAAVLAGVAIDAPCGGTGRCGRCVVRVEGDVSPPTADEVALLGVEPVASGVRLGCRVRLLGDAIVAVAAPGSIRVLDEGVSVPVEVEPPADRGIDAVEGRPYTLGAVVDIGTTTIVTALVDLENGDELIRAGALNVQYPWGADVMTRVTMAIHEGGEILHRPLVAQIERMILALLERLDALPEDLHEIAVAGNTAMAGSFVGADLSPLGSAPYEGAMIEPVYISAERVGMERLTQATCYVLPGISAFVGGDIVAGLLATAIDPAEGPVLLLDLGTNGELVIATEDGLLAASAAAGPALEGAGIESGMRAEPGAIERAWLEDGDLVVATIGGFPPVGICGSGALDILAVLLAAGILDPSGRLHADTDALGRRVVERGEVRAFVVDADGGVVLTQKDIRQLQLAKGAIRTAIDLLLAAAGVAPAEVREVFVAGGFGMHVDGAALVRLGMVPDGWEDRLTFVGNTAKEGARMALVSSATRRHAEELALTVRTLSLADHPDFQRRYIAALDFPA